MKIKNCIICILLVFGLKGMAQICGTVMDQDGNPLPFSSIHIKGTTKGTSSNPEGQYELSLDKGLHTIVVQYLGFQTLERVISYTGEKLILDFKLRPSVYLLQEITVSSDQEDPAYPIIRLAIEKRKYHVNQKPNFTCYAYTKGFIRILDAPQKILGKEIGTMDGNLDTNRKGFVYLSETVSKLSFQKPDHLHEEMLSSIISGRDNGFSFNSASSVRFNLYENSNDFGKSIVSPISDFAFSYYKYKLIGIDTSADNTERFYRIQLIPLNKSLACWFGEISIKDQDWSIQSVNVFITGKQVQQEIFDTIALRQVYIPLENDHLDKIQNQIFSFKANFLGIKLEGKFVVVFSDYALNENIKIENKKTMVNIVSGANEKSKLYWDSIRPIPLTHDEQTDYLIKDSIKIVRESKIYKDSVDSKNNRFEFMDIVQGYTYTNTHQHWNFSIGSPLELFHFNPVQGWTVGGTTTYNRWYGNANQRKKISAEFKMDYGFSERVLRPQFGMKYRFNRKRESYIAFSGGVGLNVFDSGESSVFLNEIYNLFLKKNYIKFYEKQFMELRTGSDLTTDLKFKFNVAYSRRRDVINHSEYSIRKKSSIYQANSIVDQWQDTLKIMNAHHLSFNTRISWTPDTKLWVTPKEIIKLGSDYPRFDLDYTLAYYPESRSNYHKLSLQISKEFGESRWGNLNLSCIASKVFSSGEIDLPEYIFATGNRLAVYFRGLDNNYFLALNPYVYSSPDKMVSLFAEHDFKGLLFDRIPLLNRLGFKEIARVSLLSIPEKSPYYEFSFGIGNIGYKVFRLFRLDFVAPVNQGSIKSTYLRLGIIKSFGVGGN